MTIDPLKSANPANRGEQPKILTPQQNYQQAQIFLDKWQHSGNEQDFSKVIEFLTLSTKGKNPGACHLLADLYINHSSYPFHNKKENFSAKVIEILESIPHDKNAKIRLTYIYLQKGGDFYNYRRGMRLLKESSENDPHRQVIYGLLLCGVGGHLEQFHPKEGLEILKKAIKNPGLPAHIRTLAEETIEAIDYEDNKSYDNEHIDFHEGKIPTKFEKAVRTLKDFGKSVSHTVKDKITKVALGALIVLGALLFLAGAVALIYFFPRSAIIVVPVVLSTMGYALSILRSDVDNTQIGEYEAEF